MATENLIWDIFIWVKAFHVIAVIFWMAGLLLLPRFYVYHSTAKPGGELEAQMLIAEARLMKIIMNPAMVVAFVLGLALIAYRHADLFSSAWLWVKLVFVFGLIGFHGMLSADRKKFARGERPRSEKTYRKLNEIPSIAAIVIVIMAIVEPF
ncbi:protoporphyrinogen oxidase HemJ [Robiginitomaculum antarcticum]|uniref:protoporphyrinogen oxidase HemJ n=1 Tax=Robiginitomaculum antarcticum TaxID=437507 RepID=UPI0003654CEC|nr:protoporphyrinogen oxidase HemJ [Robiginitomaculum antarcticum]